MGDSAYGKSCSVSCSCPAFQTNRLPSSEQTLCTRCVWRSAFQTWRKLQFNQVEPPGQHGALTIAKTGSCCQGRPNNLHRKQKSPMSQRDTVLHEFGSKFSRRMRGACVSQLCLDLNLSTVTYPRMLCSIQEHIIIARTGPYDVDFRQSRSRHLLLTSYSW